MKKTIGLSFKSGIYLPLALLACLAPTAHAAAIQTETKPVESEQATQKEDAEPSSKETAPEQAKADADPKSVKEQATQKEDAEPSSEKTATEQAEADAEPKSVKEQLTELQNEYNAAATKWMTDYRAAKTPEERSKVIQDNPRNTFADKFLEFYAANPEDELGLLALRKAMALSGRRGNSKAAKLLFEIIEKQESKISEATKNVVSNCLLLVSTGSPTDQAKAAGKLIAISKAEADDKAAAKLLLPLANMRTRTTPAFQTEAIDLLWDRTKADPAAAPFSTLMMVGLKGSPEASSVAFNAILEHHLDNKDFANLLTQFPKVPNPGYEAVLKEVAKNGEGDQQAQAAISLAAYIPARNRKVDQATLTEEDLAALDAENKELVELLKTFDGDSSLHKKAQDELFILENLSPGAKVMDIVGTDLAGEEFSLSDYHGKVIFLDFWGDW